ncbi:MAG: hypothetical protein ACOYUZ_02035 [Patescibacteria group bacterium]
MENETKPIDSTVDYSKADKHAYKGWMNSDSFMKRAFGVLGYNFIASCIIQAVLWGIILFFAILFGGFGAIFNLFE